MNTNPSQCTIAVPSPTTLTPILCNYLEVKHLYDLLLWMKGNDSLISKVVEHLSYVRAGNSLFARSGKDSNPGLLHCSFSVSYVVVIDRETCTNDPNSKLLYSTKEWRSLVQPK